ncbi:MAG: site-specific DNA-methyltransferase [Nitrosomonas sp.]|nr:MAG: site-specific DNA-methyltransferase [Nitrosomonas sp.]
MTSLLEQLPKIVADGKREAERIMERLESNYRIGLQTRELVIPSRDTNWQDMLVKAERSSHDLNQASMNRLIYGDNLLAMAALLAGNDETPSMRGKVDLIYIDPPFDSKADYRTNITLPGGDIEQKPTAIEQFAYSDTWQDGTASYLITMIPRLVLMSSLMSDTASIFVHLDWHVGHYVKIAMDEIFGRDNFQSHITWLRSSSGKTVSRGLPSDTDMIF